ncbi:hypothetical protein HRR80_007383 [Exophiala dermatitidis]|uniref:Uncharacterized protein n=1 Tax=Exophiala dermatitidis TaxID=5970 RepID=A0AAN6EP64_EXODE|nr:hypothetical protein HRR79_006437 [Exophiala dermatitidis]KAJ8988758.1 hypothetical protein HRR80_007383 [Exophiala dermatitidis]
MVASTASNSDTTTRPDVWRRGAGGCWSTDETREGWWGSRLFEGPETKSLSQQKARAKGSLVVSSSFRGPEEARPEPGPRRLCESPQRRFVWHKVRAGVHDGSDGAGESGETDRRWPRSLQAGDVNWVH